MAAALPPVAFLVVYIAAGNYLFDTLELYTSRNSCFLAPGIGLSYGYALYYGPDQGPILNTIYAPLGQLTFLPAAMGQTPTQVLLLAALINLGFYAGPIIALLAWQVWSHSRQTKIFCIYVFLLVVLLAVLAYPIRFLVFTISADAPALGFGLVSCHLLWLGSVKNRKWPIVLSAILAASSVWSKQTLAPLCVALPLWILLIHGRRQCLQYVLWMLGAGLAWMVVFTLWWGDALWFNILMIPSQHPWRSEWATILVRFLVKSSVFWVLLGGILWFGRKYTPYPYIPNYLNLWSIFALVGVLIMPTAFLTSVKVGGTERAFALSLLFLLVALAVALVDWREKAMNADAWADRSLPSIVLAGMVAILLPAAWLQRHDMSNALSLLSSNNEQTAYEYARRHPGRAYYPWNPLAHLLAEQKLYHASYGIYDRELAGFTCSDSHIQSEIPSRLKWVCYPPDYDEWRRHYLKDRLGGFTDEVEVDGLSGWLCFMRRMPSLE